MIEFYDRYSALGIPYPEPETMCNGQCEGTGYVPVPADEIDPTFKALWLEAEIQNPTDDGWHFVTCPSCNGTGKRK